MKIDSSRTDQALLKLIGERLAQLKHTGHRRKRASGSAPARQPAACQAQRRWT